LIVSLLDLHPSTPGADEDRLEIFEAGTGHGSLTLQLARAIHGANYPAPEIPPLVLPKKQTSSIASLWDSLIGLLVNFKTEDPYKIWRAKRRAIIHTLDISASYSTHAQHVVRNFRRGLYSPHIDFHVGTIPDYLSSRLSSTTSPFLSHAILDLPGTHKYMGIVGEALKPNGSLVTWNPSVSQVMKCVEMVRDSRLPFLLERVLETGSGTGAGPREWDVRSVKPRARAKAEAEAKAARGGWESTLEESLKVDEDGEQGAGITEAMDHSDLQAPNTEDSGWEMVCRPKVGLRIEGGGFIGLWRRMEYY
jgi:tRNA (adenine57-N1/adenine58-N1)-methyltransferase